MPSDVRRLEHFTSESNINLVYVTVQGEPRMKSRES